MSENKVTEDGLIEKALRVMQENYSQYDDRWFLRRTKHAVPSVLLHEWHRALFIHEAKLYLQEKGGYNFESAYTNDGCSPKVYLLIMGAGAEGAIDVDAPTEALAYAQAVLAASGIETVVVETEVEIDLRAPTVPLEIIEGYEVEYGQVIPAKPPAPQSEDVEDKVNG